MIAGPVVLLALLGVAASSRLRNGSLVNPLNGSLPAFHAVEVNSSNAPCQCVANNPAWVPVTRTVPKCIFIDLGAANANSFKDFMENGYGPVSSCPSGQWEAYLVEANPQFTPDLNLAQAAHVGQVHALASTAAYMCQGSTSFSIDPDVSHNHWGSSMKVQHDGSTKVTVPTINVAQFVAEHTIPGDWVMLKVDIEGAEYDIIPCLAQSSSARLVDRMYLEEHHWIKVDSVYSAEQYQAAKLQLKAIGVDVVDNYYSKTM